MAAAARRSDCRGHDADPCEFGAPSGLLSGVGGRRERGRACPARGPAQAPPLPNFTTPRPIINFNNTPLREILNFIGVSTGINVTYDRQYQDRNYTMQLNGVTLEQALNQIMTVNGLAYKVLSDR